MPAILSNHPNNEVLMEIDPDLCRPWPHHHRDQGWLTSQRCADLIRSIRHDGQIEPVIVRALQGSDKAFEIIAGVRRWFACSRIPEQKLLARVIAVDDQACMLLMHADNAYIEAITDFERAYSFASHMKSGVFKHQNDLAKVVGLSPSNLCKMIKAAALFEKPWLAALFDSKLEIPIRKAYRLSTYLKKPALCSKIEAEAQLILEQKKNTSSGLSAASILKRLLRCARAEVSPSCEGSVQQDKVFF